MKIVILNTGCSNLFSVFASINRLGYQPIISDNINDIISADKIILPGVGTAKVAMDNLIAKDLVNLIKSFARPVLGICLGMQLLGSKSEENDGVNTLNIINIPVLKIKNNNLPLPHTGWNQVFSKEQCSLFKDVSYGSYLYFVHSYMMPICSYTFGESYYGVPFTSVLQYENFFGVQFHPERSGKIGHKILKNFLEIK